MFHNFYPRLLSGISAARQYDQQEYKAGVIYFLVGEQDPEVKPDIAEKAAFSGSFFSFIPKQDNHLFLFCLYNSYLLNLVTLFDKHQIHTTIQF